MNKSFLADCGAPSRSGVNNWLNTRKRLPITRVEKNTQYTVIAKIFAKIFTLALKKAFEILQKKKKKTLTCLPNSANNCNLNKLSTKRAIDSQCKANFSSYCLANVPHWIIYVPALSIQTQKSVKLLIESCKRSATIAVNGKGKK